MEDIDAMFSDLLGEMDLLTQSLGQETVPPAAPLPTTKNEINFSIGFNDLKESLHELEDNDLDALMADLVADLNATEEKIAAEIKSLEVPSPPPSNVITPSYSDTSPLPPPLSQASKPSKEDIEAQMKADKIKLALEKLKEAKVKKLVVKVLMNDGSSKTLMVDERQNVREVLDNLFEKTHCDCNVNWSLCETNPELQLERAFEDHENLVDPLSAWTRDSENKVLFQEREEKYEVFKNPQNFYLWKKDKRSLKDMKEKDKELLIQENFCGTSIIVPDLEGVLHLKEDGKKSWKQRLFQLRASGIYYVPKGKTKSSRDLMCFVQFDNVNVYYGKDFKNRYKAPTDFCLVLKHPQIQKESQYIKYLCCDDAWTMNLWVTGIRIAKYGAALYSNFKTAEKAAVSSVWSNRSTSSSSNLSTPSPTIKGSTTWKMHFILLDFGNVPPPPPNDILPPPPPPLLSTEILPPPPPDPVLPPPPPPLAAKNSPKSAASKRHLPANVPHNPPAMDNLPPPPPPPPMDDIIEPPPDFLPPPPLAAGFGSLGMDQSLPPPPPDPQFAPPPPPQPIFTGSGAPPPPPPPPPPPAGASAAATPRAALRPTGSVKKMPPAPPKRTTPQQGGGGGGGGGGGDFMSELMLAMQKKRSGDH
uniref:Amyloid beta A4 precursor protein-binding family B member 1-interacting protein n=1 Tax=Anabas testudineus TaxID=64144 RepID=A0A7N5ZVA1_ANATE